MHTRNGDSASGQKCTRQRNDARLCRDSIFPQSQAAILEGAILNRSASNRTSDWLKRSAINRCIKPIQLAPNAAALKSWQPTTILSLGWLSFCHHWPKRTAELSSYFRPSTPSLMVITRPPPPTLEFPNLIPQQKTTHLAHCSRSTCI